MTDTPLVSVIIPCYNAEKYVEQAVRSIMEQSYKNLEILITDDCSTDNTLTILQKLANEDSRIKIFQNETNQRIVKTLNALIKNSHGKYIARMDADDISLPERIEKQVELLEMHDDISFCGTNVFIIDEVGKILNKTNLPISYKENKFFLAYYSTFSHPTVMFKAGVYKQNLYSEDFIYAEDYELWCRLFFSKNIRGENLEEHYLEYRIFKNQTSSTHNQEQRFSSSKIFDHYDIVMSENLKTHQNVFFLHDNMQYRKYKKEEIYYMKSLYKKIVHNDFSHTEFVFMRIIKHFAKMHSLSALFFLCHKPLVIRILIKKLLHRIGIYKIKIK